MSTKFTEQELKVFRAVYAKSASDTQFELFIAECEARNLRPGTHLVFQTRSTKEKDPTTGAFLWVSKGYWITTISALRLIAQRTGEYLGQGPEEYIYLDDDGMPTIISQIPLPQKGSTSIPREPWAVRVAIRRKGFPEPVIGMARFEAVAGFQSRDGGVVLNSMWAKRGPEQAGKCAAADGIRKAFAEETGSLYIAEELPNDVPEPVQHTAPTPSLPSVPKVDQTPVEGVVAARPNETKPVAEVKVVSGGVNQPTETKTVEATLPEPLAKKTTRKKNQIDPELGKVDFGTPEEIEAVLAQPVVVVNTEENAVAAQEFVEGITSFTTEEAVSQGLPEPVDPIPNPEVQKKYIDWIREFREANKSKVNSEALGKWVMRTSGKTGVKFMTVGDWVKVVHLLDEAVGAGTLRELVEG